MRREGPHTQHKMIWIVDVISWLVVLFIMAPITVLFVECAASILPCRSAKKRADTKRPVVAVIIPAHNEELLIRRAVGSVISQLLTGDRLVVIADNCSDQTASIAADAGAEVVERHDPTLFNKIYALSHGVDFLSRSPPDVVLIVDADCTMDPGSVDMLARAAADKSVPVQGCYLIESPPNARGIPAVSALAVIVKNLVRPAGLNRLGLPCLLTGSGMAFPWQVIAGAAMDRDDLVEDMQMTVDLSLRGYLPRFCRDARVISQLPVGIAASRQQRTRWEHGHIQSLLKNGPRLFWAGLRRGNIGLIVLAIDLSVPPLSLIVLTWTAALTGATVAAILGMSWWPALALAGGGGMLLAAMAMAWGKFARNTVPASTVFAAPVYALWKVPLYLAFVLRRQKVWLRTQRD